MYLSSLKIYFLLLVLLGTALLAPLATWAEEGESEGETTNYYSLFGGIEGPVTKVELGENDKPMAEQILAITDRNAFFRTIFNMILVFVGMVAMSMILIGGYYYITARGDEGQTEKGKKIVIAAVIGMLVILSAYTIVATVLGLGQEAGNPIMDFVSNALGNFF